MSSSTLALLRLYIADPPNQDEVLHDQDLEGLLADNNDDVSAAAADGWRIKAARVAEWYQVNIDGRFLSRDQVFNHCIAMAKHFEESGGGQLTNAKMDSEFEMDDESSEF